MTLVVLASVVASACRESEKHGDRDSSVPSLDASLDARSSDGSIDIFDSSIDGPIDGSSLDAIGDAASEDGSTEANHTLHIDLSDFLASPGGNWNVIPAAMMNSAIENLVDFDTGQTTPVSVSGVNWFSSGGAVQNWTAGDVDWLAALAAQDGFAGFTSSDSQLVLSGLTLPYRVEVVAAAGFDTGAGIRITVNGSTTTQSAQMRPGVDSASWQPQDDGTTPGDWLVWPGVNPIDGNITISIRGGPLNAVRLSAP
jgi:hypothetical protein